MGGEIYSFVWCVLCVPLTGTVIFVLCTAVSTAPNRVPGTWSAPVIFLFNLFIFYVHLKKDFIYLFLDRGEKEGEEHQCVVASHAPLTGDLARNPGMCPDWEMNRGPFGSQASAQSTGPHLPGLYFKFEYKV